MPAWLLLAHQLPARDSNARVKIWRRLQQIGALPTRNSVYVLPNTDQCREDFEWMRTEIVSLGGEATVFAADAVNPDGAQAIEAGFREAREADFRTLLRDAERAQSTVRRRGGASPSRRDALGRSVRALRERLMAIERIDFSHAPSRSHATEAIVTLEALAMANMRAARTPDSGATATANVGAFKGKRWVTRPRPGVDRMSSAWLIRTFIDPGATFRFADRPGPSDVAFDMYEGQFTHQGELCTFEVIANRFELASPQIVRLGQIVHDLDMKEVRYGLPETGAVGHLVDGLRLKYADDDELLEQGIAMFDALARSFETVTRQDTRRSARSGKKARSRPK